jgi:membrane-bound acyltransferase YfiQ involved in biofilm formation
VLLPWACCVPLFLALGVWQGDPPLQSLDVGKWLALGPGHLYFLVLIAQLYVVFLALPRGVVPLRWATGGLVVLQLGLMAWRTYGPLPGGALAWPGVYASHEEAPFWVGTFALGCLTASEWPRVRRLDRFWMLALIAAAAAGGLLLLEGRGISAGQDEGNAAYLWPSRLPQTIAWSLALLWLGRRFQPLLGRLWRPVRQLSQHSLGIYLLHPIFLAVLGPRTSGLPVFLRVPLLLAASFTAAYGTVHLLALTTPTAAVIGEQPASRVKAAPERLATAA